MVSLANHVADNRPGMNNPEDNWGNHLVIRSEMGFHVLLAHLRQGSVAVVEGQRVLAGAVVGSCGNSGRSPLPDLHLQAQPGPLPGEPTIPFVLKHWVRCEGLDAAGEYQLSGVPGKGMRVRPAVPSPELHAALAGWLPGDYAFELRCGDEVIEESLRLDFDEAGCFRLRAGAFLDVAVIGYRYQVAAETDAFLLTVELDPAGSSSAPPALAPKRLEARLLPRSGVVGVSGECCDGRTLRLRLTDYHPLGSVQCEQHGDSCGSFVKVTR